MVCFQSGSCGDNTQEMAFEWYYHLLTSVNMLINIAYNMLHNAQQSVKTARQAEPRQSARLCTLENKPTEAKRRMWHRQHRMPECSLTDC